MSRIDDGWQTTIAFTTTPSGGGPALTFWEKTLTPPGVDGGGANDTTTMRNAIYRTRGPKNLITLTDMNLSVAYDAGVYPDIMDMLNDNQLITITFPDASTLAFWGWLDKFEPDAIAEGEQPVATITIVCSNQNSSGVETAPLYTP